MAVNESCRHYVGRSSPTGEIVQRCRVSANAVDPFACPDDCLFFERRALDDAGWAQGSATPMSNTADGLVGLPKAPRRRRKRR